MQKLVLLMAVLAVAAPALATTVTVTATCDANVVTLRYTTDGNQPRAFALDIVCSKDANIVKVEPLLPAAEKGYWVYPGTIDIINGEVNDYGTPVSPEYYPETKQGPNAMTIEMGSLYVGGPNKPATNANFLRFGLKGPKGGGTSVITITENTIRGGIVMEDPNENPTVTLTGCTVTFPNLNDCFPNTTGYTAQYADWVTYGKPDCWCGQYAKLVPMPPSGTWKYQCYGDAKGDTQVSGKYRVYTNDYGVLSANWKKGAATDTTWNRCADIDHKGQVSNKYRVYTNDYNRIANNWKKSDSALTPACPKVDSQS